MDTPAYEQRWDSRRIPLSIARTPQADGAVPPGGPDGPVRREGFRQDDGAARARARRSGRPDRRGRAILLRFSVISDCCASSWEAEAQLLTLAEYLANPLESLELLVSIIPEKL